MRELKFRAWDLDKNKYHYDICIKPNGKIIALEIYDGEMLPIRTRCIVEQYTGLKDKNGKEIYEGDIVRWKHIYHFLLCGTGESKEYTGRVYWEEKGASFVVGDWFEPLGHLVEEDGIEVIGNIHENPELLGVENNEIENR